MSVARLASHSSALRPRGASRPGVAPAASRAGDAALKRVDSEPLVGLAWICRLRWAAVPVQVVNLSVAKFLLGLDPDWSLLALVGFVFAASNWLLGRRLARRSASRALIVAVLVGDALLLTALLIGSGGAENPFSAFYVVHVAIAALMLGPLWASILALCTSLCFGALFFLPAGNLDPHALHGASGPHLRGMLAAYMLSAGFVAYFVSRLAAALRQREAQLQALGRYAAGMERMASLSTMAAGAAHELGSPLAGIAVSATDLAEELGKHPQWRPFEREARAIRSEVSRCRQILDRLAMGAGEPAGEAPEWVLPAAVVARVQQELGRSDAARLEVEYCDAGEQRILCPPIALGHALTNLVRNGIDACREAELCSGSASDPRAGVRLTFRRQGNHAGFEVRDRGRGMSPEALERLGEPFFTTKPQGRGMGLGVYLVQTFVQQVGGRLDFEVLPSGGTLVSIMLPEGSIEEERLP
jgi:two-component system sensor histidine kinase RegB